MKEVKIMNKTFTIKGNKKEYIVYLPDQKKIKLWFIGNQLETILKAYNIKYEVKNG